MTNQIRPKWSIISALVNEVTYTVLGLIKCVCDGSSGINFRVIPDQKSTSIFGNKQMLLAGVNGTALKINTMILNGYRNGLEMGPIVDNST